MRRSKSGLAALVLATLMAPAAQAESLTVVEVNAPAVNCVFNPSCTVTVNDSTGALAMPFITTPGTAWLQSRTYAGVPGAPADGKTAYVYRLSMTQAAGHGECVAGLVLNFGPVTRLPYAGGALADVFVVTTGGLGTVGIASAQKTGDVIEFTFKNGGLCLDGGPDIKNTRSSSALLPPPRRWPPTPISGRSALRPSTRSRRGCRRTSRRSTEADVLYRQREGRGGSLTAAGRRHEGNRMRALFSALVGALALCALGSGVAAQDYPTRQIVVIVPYAPGGNTDVVARIVLEHMSRTLGQQLIVENVGGAGGTTGSARAARAAPDGYTLLVGQMGTHGAAPALYPTLSYDPLADFEHVSQLTDTPIAVFARKDFPAATLQEFIAKVKADAAKLNNGHGGVGSTSHVSCLLFTSLIGVRPTMVAYRGSGPALNDLITGTHDFMCDQIPHTAPQVQAGTIKAYAIATPERSAAMPGVPTTNEAGLPEFQASGWNAMFAPRGTPQAIVDKLAGAVERALGDPATRKRLEEIGAVIPQRLGPEALRTLVAAEVPKWRRVLRAVGVTGQ